MISVLTNNLHRMWREKSRIILTFVLTAAAVAAAIFFSSQPYKAGNIALVSENGQNGLSSPVLNITVLEQAPPLSELVRDRYDAVVAQAADGSYVITTIKSDSFRVELEQILADPAAEHTSSRPVRGPAATILGFITMFVMMEGVTLMFLFSDDKEKKQIERVAASPISFSGYLCAHGLFTFLCIFLPTMGLLCLLSLFPGINIGLSLGIYALLLGLLCAFSVAFSLFLNALFIGSDAANMAGSATVVLTSMLAGGFYAFEHGNPLLERIIQLLPQKTFFTLVERIERGASSGEILPVLLYVATVTIVFFTAAVLKTRRDYVHSH